MPRERKIKSIFPWL